MKTKKILALAIAAMLLMAVSIGGTMAWLTATSPAVVNDFTTSSIDVGLKETTGNTYKIVPGTTAKKDPVAWIVDGSEAAYLFVVIEEKNNFFPLNDSPYKYIDWSIAAGWTELTEAKTGEVDGEGSRVFWRKVDAGDTTEYPVFLDNSITYNSEITSEIMNNTIKNNPPKITITPYACQQAGVADAKTAWTYIQNGGYTTAQGN